MDGTARPGTAVAGFRSATKRFGEVVAADALSLSVAPGEFLSFLGPSGCGKTTALRMLAGFETPSEGEVLIDGAVVNDLPAHRRPVNMVFQHYALFPHLDIEANIAFGLRQRRPRVPEAEIARLVARALDMVRLPGFARRRVWEMSGGQQQRVALARAIVNEPKLLLLDEPLAALDRKLRRDMQVELQTLQRSLGITFVLVTHDQEEALSMSDRVCIMRAGRIVQTGSPRDLYDRPLNRYVADFVGRSNFFFGRVAESRTGAARLVTASGRAIPGSTPRPVGNGAEAVASIRPEQVVLSRAPADGAIPVRIATRIFLGEHSEYVVDSGELGSFFVLVPRQAEGAERSFDPGETAYAAWRPGSALILTDD
ncbi:MAG: ABC transporter ATP-binding protein [Paracoccaceae bacterium]